jgi:hypothetical protein
MRSGSAEPPLDDAAIELYARQIIVPGIGAAGQARLCNTRVAVVGNRLGAETARTYLAAAGLVVVDPPQEPVDVVVSAAVPTDDVLADLAIGVDTPIAWYALEAGRVVGGLTTARELPGLGSAAMDVACDGPLETAAHCIGALDAAATAIGAVLGWCRAPVRHTLGAAAMDGSTSADQDAAAGGTDNERS